MEELVHSIAPHISEGRTIPCLVPAKCAPHTRNPGESGFQGEGFLEGGLSLSEGRESRSGGIAWDPRQRWDFPTCTAASSVGTAAPDHTHKSGDACAPALAGVPRLQPPP